MEEAYSELYQQFLQLRSLCLRQAALLHQLATALQKERGEGAAVPNGETSDLMSIPVQCTQEIPACQHERPQPLTAAAHSAAAPCGAVGRLSRNVGTFSDLLAEDMSKLHMEGHHHQRKENLELMQNVGPLLSLDPTRWPGASKTVLQTDHVCGDRTMHTVGMPATDGLSLVGDLQAQADGLLMSDVALQSHVCEFCQAVFPGDTTTRGEFLRHLCTHVT